MFGYKYKHVILAKGNRLFRALETVQTLRSSSESPEHECMKTKRKLKHKESSDGSSDSSDSSDSNSCVDSDTIFPVLCKKVQRFRRKSQNTLL